MFANGIIDWEHDTLRPQTRQKKRRPITMIPDLNCVDVERLGRRHFRLHSERVLLDVEERPYYFAAGCVNRRRVAFSRQRFLPGFEQWIGGFHRLREPCCTSRFRAPLRR